MLLALALTAAVLDPPHPCAPDSSLSYICGLAKPEDVVALPGTRWLVASGFAPGAGLKLVDARSREARSWYTGAQEQIDVRTDASRRCPGPPDPAMLNTRGLSVRQSGSHSWRLLAVNHGGRESIEIFDIRVNRGAPPTLAWRGCLPMPAGQVANSVASFADGTILATVLTRPGTAITDFVEGRVTGGVWQWRPGNSGFVLLAGTELPGNNGIETDPDGRRFYVVAFGWHAVVVFDRRDTRRPLARIVAPDFMPDNIHWTAGRLLLAGMRLDEPACGGRRKVIDGVADPMSCHRGSVVGELDLSRKAIATVFEAPPQQGFNGLSAAALAGGQLWLGSFQASRLAVATLPNRSLQR